MFLFLAVLLTLAALAYTLMVRAQDLPEPAPVLPWAHLETRRAAIYDNLRDLQFEYRVGKLSDEDYQRTKQELQRELAAVLAEIDRLRETAPAAAPVKAKAAKKAIAGNVCPHCGARFDRALKFCGECGKPMGAQA